MNDDTQIDQHEAEGTLLSGIGTQLAPLFTWRGRDVYPVFGAEGDGEGDGDSDSESSDGAGDDAEDGTSESSSDTVSREDFDKLRNQLKAADKNRAETEKKLKAIEDGKKDELTKATEKAAELEKTVQARDSELAEMRLQNAFLTADTGITWHDPADALALAERQGYLAEVVDDEGKVNGAKLTAKLKELAKAKPHLVKSGTEQQETPKKPTGSTVGTKNKGGKDEPDLGRYAKLLNR